MAAQREVVAGRHHHYDSPEAMDPPPGTSWRALLDLVRPGTRVLDVGCATGRFAAALRQKDCRVSGVEINAEAAATARERCDEVIEGDIGQLLVSGVFDGRVFDVVVAADVLEHLVDPWSIVRGFRTLLAPGGIVLASIPNVTHA
jgi:2-polyprenyl-3-methyl-5-hydroxy-6-metoxy-1,4-benzoquinol methylase